MLLADFEKYLLICSKWFERSLDKIILTMI